MPIARKVLKEAIKNFGAESQLLLCVEEMSELQKAILKLVRFGNSPERIENIIEECADVLIMMEQLRIILEDYDIGDIQIEIVKHAKIDRLDKLMKGD